MKTGILTILSLFCLLCIQCSKENSEGFLGSAVVEATTIQIATTAQGTIAALYKDEGDMVQESEILAIIDTVPLILKRQELDAGRKETASLITAKKIEIEALESDISGVQREFNRISALVKSGAVSVQQHDNLQTQLESIKLKNQAQQAMLVSIKDKDAGILVRIEQVNDQLSRCYVKAPKNGTICTKYRNNNEVIGPGNPIFELCVHDTLFADFFVPQIVLGSLNSGDTLKVRIDNVIQGVSSPIFIPSILTWISNEAEFSPKNIQTRQSRNELVFRMRCTIANSDGILKRGLPVEIWR